MSDIICVTNRRLGDEDFLCRAEKIAAARPRAIILREKDMSPEEYRVLAERVMEICGRYGTMCVLHSFPEIALELGEEAIHLPLRKLVELPGDIKARFSVIGASCHSVSDAICAQSAGATYITAGHVFATDCKKGLPPRGLDFLRDVCGAVDIPVYGIGGISPDNISAVRSAGAAGGCVMSGLMRCPSPEEYLKGYEEG